MDSILKCIYCGKEVPNDEDAPRDCPDCGQDDWEEVLPQ